MHGTLHIERSLAVVAETTITGTVTLMENAQLILSGKYTQFFMLSCILLMARQTVTLLITARNSSFGKVMFPQVSVNQFMGRGLLGYLWCQVPSWSLVPCPFWGLWYFWSHVPSEDVGCLSSPPKIPYPPPNYKSGQYASYWNVFLLDFCFCQSPAF